MRDKPKKLEIDVSEWREHQLYVMEALAEIKADVKDIRKAQSDQDKEITHLKWKSGLISAFTGVLSAVGVKFGF